jgi:hypothetical protein
MTIGDRKNFSGEIAARYGIRIDENDPAFVVVTLNQLALAQEIAELMKEIDLRLKDFEVTVHRTEALAGKHLAIECREHVTNIRTVLQGDILAAGISARELVQQVHSVNRRTVMIRWISAGLVAALLLFVAGLWIGAHYL